MDGGNNGLPDRLLSSSSLSQVLPSSAPQGICPKALLLNFNLKLYGLVIYPRPKTTQMPCVYLFESWRAPPPSPPLLLFFWQVSWEILLEEQSGSSRFARLITLGYGDLAGVINHSVFWNWKPRHISLIPESMYASEGLGRSVGNERGESLITKEEHK